MTDAKNVQHLLTQVSRAREALGSALGLIQDLDSEKLDISAVVELLAGSVRSLFVAQEQQLTSPDPIRKAMQKLRKILLMMQGVSANDAKLQVATTTVARILAILFPVAKALSAPKKKRKPVRQSGARKAVSPINLVKQPTSRSYDERRITQRTAIKADIGIQSDSNFFTGFSTDISSGGLFVATYDMPAIGAIVNLNFRLPNGPVISVDGEVRWAREYNETTPDTPPGVGVRFLNLNAKETVAINRYMRSVPPMFFDED